MSVFPLLISCAHYIGYRLNEVLLSNKVNSTLLSVCLSLSVSLCLSVCLSTCLSPSPCLYPCLSLSLPVLLSVLVHISLCVSVLSVCAHVKSRHLSLLTFSFHRILQFICL